MYIIFIYHLFNFYLYTNNVHYIRILIVTNLFGFFEIYVMMLFSFWWYFDEVGGEGGRLSIRCQGEEVGVEMGYLLRMSHIPLYIYIALIIQ